MVYLCVLLGNDDLAVTSRPNTEDQQGFTDGLSVRGEYSPDGKPPSTYWVSLYHVGEG